MKEFLLAWWFIINVISILTAVSSPYVDEGMLAIIISNIIALVIVALLHYLNNGKF